MDATVPKKSGRKRKNEDDDEKISKDQMMQPIYKRLSNNHSFPSSVPSNTNNLKYFVVEPDPFCPESENKELDYHGGIIPSKHYRRWWPEKLLLNSIDAAPQLKIKNPPAERRTSLLCGTLPTATGHHGYSTVRATHSITQGNYYFEVKILEMPSANEDPVRLGQDDSCCRIGFATDKHVLETPVGYGNFSFGIRSKRCTIFHNGRGKHYVDGVEGDCEKNGKGKTFRNFKPGDIIGCRLSLPKINSKLTSIEYSKQRLEHSLKGKKYKVHGTNETLSGNLSSKRRKKSAKYGDDYFKNKIDPNTVSGLPLQNNLKSQYDSVLITHKKFFYFESLDLEGVSKQQRSIPKEHSCEIEFYKNGQPLGVAFSNKNSVFPIGEYFPAVSLYRSCKVEINFGPNFTSCIQLPESAKPVSKRVNETVVEAALSDMLFRIDDNVAFKKLKAADN